MCVDVCVCVCASVNWTALLLMVLWCPLLKNCPLVLNPLPGGSTTPVARFNGSLDAFSLVLLYFKHSNRYLCIDDSGRVYSRRRVCIISSHLYFNPQKQIQEYKSKLLVRNNVGWTERQRSCTNPLCMLLMLTRNIPLSVAPTGESD